MTLATIAQSGILKEGYKVGDSLLYTLKVDALSILLSFYKPVEGIEKLLNQQVSVTGQLTTHKGTLQINCDPIIVPCSQALSLITVVGRLGKDPEIKIFDSGKTVVKCSLAVNKYKSNEPDWFNFEAWNKTSEVVANYTSKGSLLGCSGSLKVEQYKNNKGQEVIKPVISARNVYLMPKSMGNTSENKSTTYATQESTEAVIPF